jgi:hypothetical protein
MVAARAPLLRGTFKPCPTLPENRTGDSYAGAISDVARL